MAGDSGPGAGEAPTYRLPPSFPFMILPMNVRGSAPRNSTRVGDSVIGQSSAAERDQLVGGERVSGIQHHVRDQDGAAIDRAGRHRHFANARQLVDHLFDLARIHLCVATSITSPNRSMMVKKPSESMRVTSPV